MHFFTSLNLTHSLHSPLVDDFAGLFLQCVDILQEIPAAAHGVKKERCLLSGVVERGDSDSGMAGGQGRLLPLKTGLYTSILN